MKNIRRTRVIRVNLIEKYLKRKKIIFMNYGKFSLKEVVLPLNSFN